MGALGVVPIRARLPQAGRRVEDLALPVPRGLARPLQRELDHLCRQEPNRFRQGKFSLSLPSSGMQRDTFADEPCFPRTLPTLAMTARPFSCPSRTSRLPRKPTSTARTVSASLTYLFRSRTRLSARPKNIEHGGLDGINGMGERHTCTQQLPIADVRFI